MPGKKDFSNRKELRLKKYDYSSTGAYFVTICVKDRMPILSHILKPVGGGALDAPFFLLHAMGENFAIMARAIFTPSTAAEVMPPA